MMLLKERRFIGLRLKSQISPFHVISYFLMAFTIQLAVQFIIQFLVFILESKDYYDIPKDEVGSVAGNCGFIAELFVLALDVVLGLIFDTVGRKTPTVIGFMMVGGSISATPFFKEVYPGFLAMRIVMSLGIIPGVNTPLLPDYVVDKSLGLASAYVSPRFRCVIAFLICESNLTFVVKWNICDCRHLREHSTSSNFKRRGPEVDFYWNGLILHTDGLLPDLRHQRRHKHEERQQQTEPTHSGLNSHSEIVLKKEEEILLVRIY
jgi:hypothetical protein